MQVIDSHCHIASINPTNQNINNPRLVVAISDNEWEDLYNIRKNYPAYKIGFGIHPWVINQYSKDNILKLEEYILKYSPDCIGEIGLDKLKPNFIEQINLFELQLQIAKKYNLAVVIHCVKAYNEVIQLLKKHKISRGIVHAFNANAIIASTIKELGLYIGIGGFITKSTTIKQSISQIDIQNIILESDAPFMPCFNNSISLSEDCDKYAQILADHLKIDTNMIMQISNNNFMNLFRK